MNTIANDAVASIVRLMGLVSVLSLAGTAAACGQARDEGPRPSNGTANEPTLAAVSVVGAGAGEAAPALESKKPASQAPGCACAEAMTERANDSIRREVSVGSAPVRGAKDAKVTIVVYSDFQCPYCAHIAPVLESLEQQYRGRVRVAYKNNPLPMHEHAALAAKAALAAGEQGKFWQYHDVLTKHPRELERPALEAYAREVGLDVKRFASDLDASRLDARVKADIHEAELLDVRGTPTVFVNGKRVVGARGREAFEAAIDEELRANGL